MGDSHEMMNDLFVWPLCGIDVGILTWVFAFRTSNVTSGWSNIGPAGTTFITYSSGRTTREHRLRAGFCIFALFVSIYEIYTKYIQYIQIHHKPRGYKSINFNNEMNMEKDGGGVE